METKYFFWLLSIFEPSQKEKEPVVLKVLTTLEEALETASAYGRDPKCGLTIRIKAFEDIYQSASTEEDSE